MNFIELLGQFGVSQSEAEEVFEWCGAEFDILIHGSIHITGVVYADYSVADVQVWSH